MSIVALRFDADGNDNENKNDEWIDIRNDGSAVADLGGWSVTDEAAHVYRFPTGFTLAPGSTVRLFTGCGSATPTEQYWCNSGSAIWNNGGDTATLTDASGGVIDTWAY